MLGLMGDKNKMSSVIMAGMMPEKKEEGVEKDYESAKRASARKVLDAIHADDAAALSAALQEHHYICDDEYEMAEESEGEENE
jgi:hypothetical protein